MDDIYWENETTFSNHIRAYGDYYDCEYSPFPEDSLICVCSTHRGTPLNRKFKCPICGSSDFIERPYYSLFC